MNKYKVYLNLASRHSSIYGSLGYGWFTAEAGSSAEVLELYQKSESYRQALLELAKPFFALLHPTEESLVVVPQTQFQHNVWDVTIQVDQIE